MITSTMRRDTASRLVKASPSAVYAAFVASEAVAQWLPPEGAMMEIQVFEPRVGGRFQMTLIFASAPGKSTANTDVVVGRFVERVPQQRIVQAFEFDSPDPVFAGAMTMRWELEEAAGGTAVTVVAENVPPGISQTDHETGMNSSLTQRRLRRIARLSQCSGLHLRSAGAAPHAASRRRHGATRSSIVRRCLLNTTCFRWLSNLKVLRQRRCAVRGGEMVIARRVFEGVISPGAGGPARRRRSWLSPGMLVLHVKRA